MMLFNFLFSLAHFLSRQTFIPPLPSNSPYRPPPAVRSQPILSGCICECHKAGERKWGRPGWESACEEGADPRLHLPEVRHQKAFPKVASATDLALPVERIRR